MEEKTKSRLQAIYYLRTIEKKTQVEIAESLGVSQQAVSRALKLYRPKLGLTEQDATDLIYFYEQEIVGLIAKRQGCINNNFYIGYTRLIIELQDKIAELLKLRGPNVHVDNSSHLHITYGYRTQRENVKNRIADSALRS